MSEQPKHTKKRSTSSVSYRSAQNASYKPVSSKKKRRHSEEELPERPRKKKKKRVIVNFIVTLQEL